MTDPRGRYAHEAIFAILAIGTILRLLQYLAGTSLWFDELALALNIDERPLRTLLTQPLDRSQVAPVGFVAAVKVSTLVLGADSLGFRLVPTLGGLAALFVAWRVARRVLNGWALGGALLLIAVSPALLWYGGNVKPYAGDVALTMLLVLLALRYVERPDDSKRAVVAGATGAVAGFFSFPAVTTAAVLGALLTGWWLQRRPRPRLAPLAALLGPWALGALAASLTAMALVDASTREYMDRFWRTGFPPSPWWSVDALVWPWRQWFSALGNVLMFVLAGSPPGRIYVWVCALLAAAGLGHLFGRAPWPGLLVLAPAIAAAAGAMAHVLPFEGRVALYAGWPLLVVTFAGMQALHARGGRLGSGAIAVGAVVAAVPAVAVLGLERPPYRAQEARPVLATLAERYEAGDVLFGYYGARHAIAFYGPRTGLTDWVVGQCHREHVRNYFHELDRFRGRGRVWFFFTHSALGYREPEVIRSYLEAIGIERDRIPDPFGNSGQEEAAAYLFDLSDPVRLAAATADTFEHGRVTTGGMRILCDGTRLAPAS